MENIADLTQNKDFLKWYEKTVKDNIIPHLTPNEATKLVNKIYDWYTIIKYPERSTINFKSYGGNLFPNLENISSYLTFDQFMFRLYDINEIDALRCYYRGSKRVDLPNEEGFSSIGDYDNYVISVRNNDSILNDGNFEFMFEDELKKEKDITIQELYFKIMDNKNYEDLTKIISNCLKYHATDLILRDYIFRSVVNKFIKENTYNNNRIHISGLQTALKFIKEINDFFTSCNIKDHHINILLKNELEKPFTLQIGRK